MKQAVIQTGGKQYLVDEGQELKVEKLSVEKGAKFVFDKILLFFDDKNIKLGEPYIDNASVEAEILEQGKSKKITAAKYKNKTRYYKRYGHRQPFTKVKIKKIV